MIPRWRGKIVAGAGLLPACTVLWFTANIPAAVLAGAAGAALAVMLT